MWELLRTKTLSNKEKKKNQKSKKKKERKKETTRNKKNNSKNHQHIFIKGYVSKEHQQIKSNGLLLFYSL